MAAIQFTGAQTAGPWYPSDGYGGFSGTLSDSIVADYELTRILQVDVPGTGATSDIGFYHRALPDGTGATLAYAMTFSSQERFFKLNWPNDLILIGSWYVLFDIGGGSTNARDTFHVQYEREA